MQLFPHNFSRCQIGPIGHTGNPHNPTKTTTTNLSGSGSMTEFGDRITRRPVPLVVHPFWILWNLINRSVGASPSSSRIPPNLIAAFLHESYIGKNKPSEASLLLHAVFQPTLGNNP